MSAYLIVLALITGIYLATLALLILREKPSLETAIALSWIWLMAVGAVSIFGMPQ